MRERKRIDSSRLRSKAEALEGRLLLSAAAPSLASVSGLTLINASTDLPVSGVTLANGAVIDLGQTGHRLSILANLGPGAVGSVRFNYDGNPNFGIENSAPYAIAGASHGGREYLPWLPTVGMHTLIVTSYPGRNATGQAGQPDILLFNVIDSSASAPPVNVNAGGNAYTDSAGNVFRADSGFFGGQQRFSNVPIASTADPALYQSRRQGHFFGFFERVPDDTYAVTLYFADPGNGRGANVFDVTSDGTALLTDYNIAADAGLRTAVQKSFIAPVTDGSINLAFRAEQGDAMVSAISIAPQRVPLVESPIYVNAGGLSYTDSVGRTFEAGIGFSGGQTSQSPFPTGNTADAPLFYSYRAGSQFTFSQPAANGDYELWLEFAEPTGTQPGQRVFDVSADGQTILSNFDIVADAGANSADVKAFDVEITGGKLDLSFQGVVGDAILSSIALVPKDIPAVAAPYTLQDQPPDVREIADSRTLVVIGQAILAYVNYHKGRFAPDLSSLVQPDFLDPKWLVSPRTGTLLPRGELSSAETLAWARTLNDYIYLGAGLLAGRVKGTTPIAYDNPDLVSGDINILFDSGYVGRYSRIDAAAILGIPIGAPTDAPNPVVAPPPDPSIVQSQTNLAAIGLGALNYAFEQIRNGLTLPPDLGTIAITQDISLQDFVNPRSDSPPAPAGLTTEQEISNWVNSTDDYIYVGAGKQVTTPSYALIAYENPAAMSEGISMVFNDATVDFHEMRWAVETILHDRAAFPRSYL